MGGNTAQPLTNQPVAAPAPTNEPATPSNNELDFGVEAGSAPQEPNASAPNPLEKQPFDAGVEADEKSDPKKFIEQLTGKLGQSLRSYTQTKGQPDFELEKFAINSLLSATHTGEMTPEDKNDIVKKVEKSGNNSGGENQPIRSDDDNNSQDVEASGNAEPPADDSKNDNLFETDKFLLSNPKKNNMFQDGSNDILDDLKEQKKNSIFANIIKNKLIETFNLDDMLDEFIEPETKPIVKPKEKPEIKPSRRDLPFLPNVTPNVQPKPKALK